MRTTVLTRKQTRLTAAVTAAATTFYVQSVADLPTVPWLAILNSEGQSPEVVLVTTHTSEGIAGNLKTLTVVRGAMGTTARIHKTDTIIREYGQKVIITGHITDISTAASVIIPMPKGFLLRVAGVLEDTIATADSIITVTKNATALGTITVAYDSSAAGDWDEMLADGVDIGDFFFDGVDDFLTIATGGQSTETMQWQFIIEYIPY